MKDSIITRERTSTYTIVPNTILRDERISLKARGLYSTVYSFPEDWELTILGLASILREGRDAISSAFKELETYGYLSRQRSRDAGGHLTGTSYHFFNESLLDRQKQKTPMTDNPLLVQPITENPLLVNPTLDCPTTDLPMTENPTQYNNIINKEINIINKERNKETSFVCPLAEYQPLMDEFFAYRKQIKKPMKTDRGRVARYNKLVSLSHGDVNLARLILDQTMEKEWEDFYELKQDFNGTKQADSVSRINVAITAKQSVLSSSVGTRKEVSNILGI